MDDGPVAGRRRWLDGAVSAPPLVPTLPLRMRDTEILTVAYRTTPEAVARFLPPELEPLAPRAIVHLYRMHDAEWFGRYGESAVHIPARHVASGTTGAYSPLLFVEGDGPVAAGREIYGQPKKSGEIELRPVGDLLVGRLRRNGITVITATMPYKQQPADLDELDALGFRTNINVKVVPAVDGSGNAVHELAAREFEDVAVHELWRGPGTVELRPNAQAPVHLLPVLEVEIAFHWRVDFTLTHGRVLEDLR
jgi:acetoacetate decarboxylase